MGWLAGAWWALAAGGARELLRFTAVRQADSAGKTRPAAAWGSEHNSTVHAPPQSTVYCTGMHAMRVDWLLARLQTDGEGGGRTCAAVIVSAGLDLLLSHIPRSRLA